MSTAPIGTLAEGTAVVFNQPHFDLTTRTTTFKAVKGYVGQTRPNIGGKNRVVLMRTKTTGQRIGSLDPSVTVTLR
jgi:hypothetical protein